MSMHMPWKHCYRHRIIPIPSRFNVTIEFHLPIASKVSKINMYINLSEIKEIQCIYFFFRIKAVY